ncbi:MAG: CDP-glycerol glycerophosphotransferase family protein [Thermoplasmata archaeon]
MAPIRDGKSLADLTEYRGTTLWWFVHTFFSNALERMVKGASATASGGGGSSFPRSIRSRSLLPWAYLAYELFASRVGQWFSRARRGEEGGRRILMVSHTHQWKLLRDPHTEERRKGDAFFDSTISALEARGDFEILTTYPLGGPPDPWYFPLRGLRTLAERRRAGGRAFHRPFEAYWSAHLWRDGMRARRRFVGMLEGIKAAIQEHLSTQEGYDLDLLEDFLDYHFSVTFPRVVEHIDTAKRLLEAERPDLILLTTEYGLFERALVVGARMKGIPTLAVQHGVIHPRHFGYIYPPGAVATDGSVSAPHVPIPDRTAVYGQYHKEILTELGAYPSNSVIVTGQPRYDLLEEARQRYDSDRIRGELGLAPSGKLVLWTTQTHGLPAAENEANIDAVYGALHGLEGVGLVVKLHPLEDQGAPLYRKHRLNHPIIVDGEGDTFALLHACDLMITGHSTTALEAVALSRPVIILNLSGDPDPVDYVQAGVAVGVYRAEDLRPTIERLLVDDGGLAENRERYIQRYLYRVDGKATERVVNLIEEMIEA